MTKGVAASEWVIVILIVSYREVEYSTCRWLLSVTSFLCLFGIINGRVCGVINVVLLFAKELSLQVSQ